MAKWERRFRFPHDSGPHRLACKALYRALLEQCTRVILPADLPSQGAINPIKHLIRKGFRRHQYDCSPRLAVKALKVGYNAAELLRAAISGSQPATSQIHALLHRLHAQRQESQQPQGPRRERLRVWPYPGAPKVLDVRPLPLEKLSGNRHVPVLTQCTGYPFLRFKKPQSPFLSRVLRDKMKQKHNWFEKIKDLDSQLNTFAAWEGKWENHILRELEQESGARKEWVKKDGTDWGERDGWSREVRHARDAIWKRLLDNARKAKVKGAKMVEIFDEEKAMWEEERSTRRKEKLAERQHQKEERGVSAPKKRDIE